MNAASSRETILTVENACVSFPARGEQPKEKRTIQALDGVSLEVSEGQSLGIVGETGCGKTTLARAIVGLQSLSAGSIRVRGAGPGGARRRGDVQMVFQDPFASLDPHQRVRSIVGESVTAAGLATKREIPERVAGLLDLVGLSREVSDRRATELSGGQRQRVGIARALASEPRLIVCDEPVTALDVSVQAQIINLLIDLRERLRLTYVFIAHDVAVVEQVSERVAVMYLGRVVETGPVGSVLAEPRHPYTAALVSAIPSIDPVSQGLNRSIPLAGEPPSPIDPPSGCRFHPRCWLSERLGRPASCLEDDPRLSGAEGSDQCAACHFASVTQTELAGQQQAV